MTILITGCLYGGTITYESNEVGYDVTLEGCAFSEGLALTGEGLVNDEEETFSLSAEFAEGGDLTYGCDAAGELIASGDRPVQRPAGKGVYQNLVREYLGESG